MDKPTISFETDRLYVRSISENDKECYMALRVGVSEIKKLYERRKELIEEEWENELNSDRDISMAAFFKIDNTFVACASFQNYQKETIEFGFDVVEEYRNRGIATELVMGMLDATRSFLKAENVVIRVRKENTISYRRYT